MVQFSRLAMRGGRQCVDRCPTLLRIEDAGE